MLRDGQALREGGGASHTGQQAIGRGLVEVLQSRSSSSSAEVKKSCCTRGSVTHRAAIGRGLVEVLQRRQSRLAVKKSCRNLVEVKHTIICEFTASSRRSPMWRR